LAATLVGVELGLSLDEIKAGLESFKLTKNRLQWINGLDKSFILNDAYNASPSSMKAVLEYFSTISIKGKKIVVLGDILELGDLSKELHQSLSSSLLKEPFDFVVLYGNQMKYLYESLEDKLPKEKLIHFSGDKSQMVDYLKQTISSEDAVLIKSSFGTDLLSVVDALKDEK
ncbi:UDP-N-acetylmuramoyl-tripeptide--D-alanyl-D-alanine ligase, partial [Klebsiella oxytoca]